MSKKVSVILPTCNRYEVALENIEHILSQKYKNFELIVCDDSEVSYLKENVALKNKIFDNPKVQYNYVARYTHEGKKDYGLSRGRNIGSIQANGEILIFLDDRITPAQDDMISVFAEKVESTWEDKVWYFGDKGAHKTAFVENCSAIRRKMLINAGMFCERIEKYGGITRELLARFTIQGFKFVYVPEALAMPLTKSRDRERKEAEIVETKKFLKKMGY